MLNSTADVKLTWINSDKNRRPSKITGTSAHLSSLPVAIERIRRVRKQRVGLKARTTWLNLVTICSRSTSVVHRFLDDRVGDRRLSHAPHRCGRGPSRRRRHRRRWVYNGRQESRARDDSRRRRGYVVRWAGH